MTQTQRQIGDRDRYRNRQRRKEGALTDRKGEEPKQRNQKRRKNGRARNFRS